MNINKIKIALLEKVSETKMNNKTDYISKISATFLFDNYLKEYLPEANELDEENLLSGVVYQIYTDLKDKINSSYNAIGIWLTIKDKIIENSIDLTVLDNIEEYGEPGIVPIFEFVKMTLEQHESEIC